MKSIPFNTEMVRALLDGRKTVTRRAVKPQPKMQPAYIYMGSHCGKWSYPSQNCVEQSGWEEKYRRVDGLTAEDETMFWTPPYHTCDILYVQETWATHYTADSDGNLVYCYKADGIDLKSECLPGEYNTWHPSIHMPKEAARLFLRVTGVRVERLQDMTGHDVLAEGVDNGSSNPKMGARWENMQRMAFEGLWNSTIKKADLPRYGWAANPWVWVIEFERISKEEVCHGKT